MSVNIILSSRIKTSYFAGVFRYRGRMNIRTFYTTFVWILHTHLTFVKIMLYTIMQ